MVFLKLDLYHNDLADYGLIATAFCRLGTYRNQARCYLVLIATNLVLIATICLDLVLITTKLGAYCNHLVYLVSIATGLFWGPASVFLRCFQYDFSMISVCFQCVSQVLSV